MTDFEIEMLEAQYKAVRNAIEAQDETASNNDAIKNAIAKLNDIAVEMTEAIKEVFSALADMCKEPAERIVEVFKELTELIEDVELENSDKYKPCKSIGKPSVFNYGSKKLWRKNRALFRPYKRQAKQN